MRPLWMAWKLAHWISSLKAPSLLPITVAAPPRPSRALPRQDAQYKVCGACTEAATRWEGQKWGWGPCAE